jgi:hypothetical protein
MPCYIEQVVVKLVYLTVAGLSLLIAAVSAAGPVARHRVALFARRQRLTITVANGEQVIRYLATTRRWRAAGIGAGLVVSFWRSIPDGSLNFNFPLMFAGWFLGALVAEARVAHLNHGRRRVASLQPRRPQFYLSRTAWLLVPIAAGVAVGTGALTAALAVTGAAHPDWTAVSWLVVALAVAMAVRTVQRSVVDRAQPLAEPDVLAADDAIRSRSLHVLAGGGAALILLCVTAQVSSIHPTALDAGNAIQAWLLVAGVLIAALGWNVATVAWPSRRALGRASAPAPGAP